MPDEPFALSDNLARGFDPFTDPTKKLFIHRLAIGPRDQEMDGRAGPIARDEHSGNSAAQAEHGTGAMQASFGGIHYAEITFRVDDFASEGKSPQWNRARCAGTRPACLRRSCDFEE